MGKEELPKGVITDKNKAEAMARASTVPRGFQASWKKQKESRLQGIALGSLNREANKLEDVAAAVYGLEKKLQIELSEIETRQIIDILEKAKKTINYNY